MKRPRREAFTDKKGGKRGVGGGANAGGGNFVMSNSKQGGWITGGRGQAREENQKVTLEI